MFHGCLARRPYPRDTLENQLSPSCPDSSHSSHVQGICITSWDAYSWAIRENTSIFNALSFHTLSLSHTTLTNKSHMKYRVQKIEQNYNQIWHRIKANKTHSYKLQLYNWKLENVLKHKSCLDPQIKDYGSIDFTLTYTKCGIE